MNIFTEIRMHLTARQAAEKYGLAVRKNGMACCPFHRDKHPSMKIDKNYHCFACGIGGDAIDYVSRMFGLTQYQAAKKLIDDFSLMVEHGRTMALSAKEKEKIRKARQENERIIRIKKRFGRWCSESIGLLRNCIDEIRQAGILLTDKAQNQIFTDDYTSMLNAEPIMEYWLDILCMGTEKDRQELFLLGRKGVDRLAETVGKSYRRIVECNRRSA